MDVELSCGWFARNDHSMWRAVARYSKFWLRWRLGELAGSVSCHRCSVYRKAADRSQTVGGLRTRIMETGPGPVWQIVKSTRAESSLLEYFTIGYNSLGNSPPIPGIATKNCCGGGWPTHLVRQDGL